MLYLFIRQFYTYKPHLVARLTCGKGSVMSLQLPMQSVPITTTVVISNGVRDITLCDQFFQ